MNEKKSLPFNPFNPDGKLTPEQMSCGGPHYMSDEKWQETINSVVEWLDPNTPPFQHRLTTMDGVIEALIELGRFDPDKRRKHWESIRALMIGASPCWKDGCTGCNRSDHDHHPRCDERDRRLHCSCCGSCTHNITTCN